MLKQRLDLPFENKIETMDSLAKMHGKKNVETTVRYFCLKTEFKLFIDSLKPKANKIVDTTVRFPFENKIESMDTLA